MNQIFLGEPSQYIRNWFIKTFPYWPAYTTLEFVDGTTQTKEISGIATRQNIFDEYVNDCGEDEKTETLVYCKLGKNVTEINNRAFGWCYSLTAIDIPNSVTSIGYYAFGDCRSLTSINIPSSVTLINNQTFSNCSSLTSIAVDTNNPRFDSRDNCNAIIETSSNTLVIGFGNSTIPNSVTSIGSNAFNNCDSLTSVNIGNSVSSIGDYAFYYCKSLTSVNIGNSVTSIGSQAFAGCRSLTAITIPNSVISIKFGAFQSCNLSSINIPSSVTSIGEYVFGYCDSLTSVIFEGRAMSDIISMSGYPWDLNTSIIVPGIK